MNSFKKSLRIMGYEIVRLLWFSVPFYFTCKFMLNMNPTLLEAQGVGVVISLATHFVLDIVKHDKAHNSDHVLPPPTDQV